MQDLQKTPHFLWQPACSLQVTGEDALTFLQGQFTNDLGKLIPKQAVYGLWLTQKGKVLADSFVVRTGEESFWVGSYACEGAVIRERLERYIIADEVEIADETADWWGVTLFTDADRETVERQLPPGLLFPGRRDHAQHWEWVGTRDDAERLKAKLDSACALSAEEMLRRRIRAEIPAVPVEMGENDLPNEGGLDRDAVSFNKGCYLGQEVMARLKAMGKVRRKLMRVRGGGKPPELPALLFAGERKVGELRSWVAVEGGFEGLAMITLMHLPEDKKLALSADSDGMIDVILPS